MSVYFLLLQSFVLRVEVILNAILLLFYLLELLLGIVALATFARSALDTDHPLYTAHIQTLYTDYTHTHTIH